MAEWPDSGCRIVWLHGASTPLHRLMPPLQLALLRRLRFATAEPVLVFGVGMRPRAMELLRQQGCIVVENHLIGLLRAAEQSHRRAGDEAADSLSEVYLASARTLVHDLNSKLFVSRAGEFSEYTKRPLERGWFARLLAHMGDDMHNLGLSEPANVCRAIRQHLRETPSGEQPSPRSDLAHGWVKLYQACKKEWTTMEQWLGERQREAGGREFVLPIATGTSPPPEDASTSPPGYPPDGYGTILAADDHGFHPGWATCLERLGYGVQVVTTLDEARAELAANPAAIFVCDLQWGDDPRAGLSLMRLARRSRVCRLIVAVSATPFRRDEAAEADGALDAPDPKGEAGAYQLHRMIWAWSAPRGETT